MQNNIQSYPDLIPGRESNKRELTADARGKEGHTVWINKTERIVSFGALKGYTEQTFATHECFMSYLLFLQEHGFRFR